MSNSIQTITKTELEAVEKEYTICPNCEMEYDPDEMIPIYVNPKIKLANTRTLCWLHKAEDRQEIMDALTVSHETDSQLCKACAKSTFGYDYDLSAANRVFKASKSIRQWPFSVLFLVVFLSGGFIGALFVLDPFFFVFTLVFFAMVFVLVSA